MKVTRTIIENQVRHINENITDGPYVKVARRNNHYYVEIYNVNTDKLEYVSWYGMSARECFAYLVGMSKGVCYLTLPF